MSDYRLTHLDDSTLLRDLGTLVEHDRSTLAAFLAHLAEVDARRLYLPAAYPSMFAYCVSELRLSEDAAYKRIRAARAARAFPRLFEDLATGRLHLTAACLLAPHLTSDNLEELVANATHRSKAEIEVWLIRRFASTPAPPARITAVRPPARAQEPVPGQAVASRPGFFEVQVAQELVPERATVPPPTRFVVQLPIGEAIHAKLREVQRLLGHAVPSGDLVEVFERALDALLAALVKRKFAATDEPRLIQDSRSRAVRRARSVPAHVRRAVWKRDEGQCTFVSADGRRCGSRRLLEFDHVVPFARGGEATVAGLRLRCRAHNQYEAGQAFGEAFMQRKRDEAGQRRRDDSVPPAPYK